MALTSPVNRRYARALVDAAAKLGPTGVDQVAEEITRFASAVATSQDLTTILTNPVFTSVDREKALGAVLDKMQPSELVRRFFLLLSERDRMQELAAIAESVRRLADEGAGRLRAVIETASPLSPDAAESLRRALEKRTGKTIALDVTVNPALLGGVRAQIGSTVLDGTIRAQLDQLRDRLVRDDARGV